LFLLLVWALGWPAALLAAEQDFPAGKSEDLVKEAIKFIKDNEGENPTDADEDLTAMLGTNAADGKKELREQTSYPLGSGDTNSARIAVGLPPQADIETDITKREGFRQVKTLAQTLYHEWVHWGRFQQYDGDLIPALDQNWAKCEPLWDEVEAYYNELKLKLEWKLARERRLSQIPGYGPTYGPPTPGQETEGDRLQNEIRDLENQIDDVVNNYLGGLREINGKKKRYEDNGRPLAGAFAGKTNQQRYDEVVDRLNDVSEIDPREDEQSLDDKIDEKIEEYRRWKEFWEKWYITPDYGWTIMLAASEGGYPHSFEMTGQVGTLYAATEITATWINSDFMEPWTQWGRRILSPVYHVSAPAGAMANPAYPSTVSLTYNPGLVGDRSFHVYHLRATVVDDSHGMGGDEPPWKLLTAESIDYNTAVISANSTDPFSLYVVMEEMPVLIAGSPSPAQGIEGVAPEVMLSWSPGECTQQASGHHVYLGTDYVSVRDANMFDSTGIYLGAVDVNYHSPSAALALGTTYYWRVDQANDVNIWQGPVWWFTTAEAKAHNPDPINGWVSVAADAVLAWDSGFFADSHDVYFGTDWEDVNDANTTDTTGIYQTNLPSGGNTGYEPWYNYGPPELGHTYYWRIDEVNQMHPDNPWKGDVWTFTTAYHLVVDNFEQYDLDQNSVQYTWYDQYSQEWGEATGARLELARSPKPVHGGDQAVAYTYDTDDPWADLYYAEAWLPLEEIGGLQDWTDAGVKVLTLFFCGDPNNDANDTEQMYVGLADSDGLYAEIRYGDYWGGEDMNDLKIEEWQRWDIALQHFSDPNYAAVPDDVDLGAIAGLYIGFGNRRDPVAAGSGVVYLDDIRLYPPICAPSIIKPVADLNGNCTVDWPDMGIMAEDWLEIEEAAESPANLYDAEPPDEQVINFRDFAVLLNSWLEQKLWPE